MTVFTKPSLKKTPLIDDNHCSEEVIDIRPSVPHSFPDKRYKGAILCTGVIAALLLLMGVITAMQIYEQVMNDVQRHNRYKGFCSIPVPRDIQRMEQLKAPLHWTVTENEAGLPEVQMMSFIGDSPTAVLDTLREELDIDIDNAVEKISVINNGHPVKFVHDFDTNLTGIVDPDRCFMMEMDPSMVVQPEVFVLGLQRGEEFDVSRMRTVLRAVLKHALSPENSPLREHCRDKPVYPLEKDDSTDIRKRSVDEPPHDYMQFAGNRIQEIEIKNLAELLEFEQKNKLEA